MQKNWLLLDETEEEQLKITRMIVRLSGIEIVVRSCVKVHIRKCHFYIVILLGIVGKMYSCKAITTIIISKITLFCNAIISFFKYHDCNSNQGNVNVCLHSLCLLTKIFHFDVTNARIVKFDLLGKRLIPA